MSDLDTIKSRLSCRDVAERLGIHVPHKGDAECPKHKGHSLRLKDDYFKCWGGCAEQGGQGDVIQLYQWVTGADFKTAVETLGQWAGVAVEWSADETRRLERRRQVEDVLDYAAAFYVLHYEGSTAASYAEERGWAALAETARLGYAPDAWDLLVKSLKEAGIALDLAMEAGLIRQRDDGKYFDLFRHRLVIPFIERGRVVYLQARSLGKGDTTSGEPKYLNTAREEPPLYHVNGALQSAAPILTESTSDVLSFERAGLAAFGTAGAEAKPHQIAKLQRYEALYVATHDDAAGRKFVDALALQLGERVRPAPPPEPYKDWDEALAAGVVWAPDEALTWLRWRVRQIDPKTDPVLLRRQLDPILAYLAQLDDAALIATYLTDLRSYFSWPRDVAKGYERDIRQRRTAQQKQATEAKRVEQDDVGAAVNLLPDVIFINPAQAYYDGIVYVSRQVTRREQVQNKFGGARLVEVNRPVVITSDRRILPMPLLQRDDPPGTVLYLDGDRRLALHSPVQQAAYTWSYECMAAHIRGDAPAVEPHAVYDAVHGLFYRYLYHPNDDDYVIDVLWTIGTYFHQIFDAYPYLNIHGQKGSGKTTVLVLLGHLAFNAYHVTNVSEASLFRWIEAAAPTMLIDEQEGLTSRQAAREQKADLMGILKSGYQKGPVVTRQDTNDPSIMRQFRIYCPKAIASVELLEDILGDRSLLTYMHKPADDLFSTGRLIPRNRMREEDFGPARDQLYLLLMQHAPSVAAIAPQVRMTYAGRFGELALPLFTVAALIDHSRGQGPQVVTQLARALDTQQQRRVERNDTTPEQMLRAAVELAAAGAYTADADQPHPADQPQRLSNGQVVMDSLHIADAFKRLFPSAKESYFSTQWLGKQVSKADYIQPWEPPGRTAKTLYRWERATQERNEATGEAESVVKVLSVYIVRL